MDMATTQLASDIGDLARIADFIEVAPPRLFTPSLIEVLADASDRIACKVGKLQEMVGAN